jgi:hypothetical protein
MPTVTSSSALTLTELFGEYVIRKGGRFLQYVGTNLRREDGGFSRKDGGYQEQMEVASAFSESRKCLPPHHQQICLVKKTYQEQAVDFSNTLAEILRNLRREIERGGGFSRKEIEQGSNLQLEPI